MQIEPQMLARQIKRNQQVIKMQVEGLSHADSVMQLPFRSNCMNWVLGHIVDNRNGMLKALGEEPIWTNNEGRLYQTESEPITPETESLPLERLLDDLDTTRKLISSALKQTTAAQLAAERDDGSTTGEMLEFMVWHETYHVGQTESLRQLAGKNDKVI